MIVFISVALSLTLLFLLICWIVIISLFFYEKGSMGYLSGGTITMLVASSLITVINIIVVVFWFIALAKDTVVWLI